MGRAAIVRCVFTTGGNCAAWRKRPSAVGIAGVDGYLPVSAGRLRRRKQFDIDGLDELYHRDSGDDDGAAESSDDHDG